MSIVPAALLPVGPDQATFDRVCEGLAAQGFRQAIKDGGCRYRTEDCRCAVGVLIPDDRYTPAMEFQSLYSVLQMIGVTARHDRVPEETVLWFNHLQQAHDAGGRIQTPAEMRQRLREFAIINQLTAPAVIAEVQS